MVLAHTKEGLEKFETKPQKPELADIFSQFGDSYRKNHKMPMTHYKVMHAVEVCRTSYLGGHMKKCDSCGYEHPTYNSCATATVPNARALPS